LCITKLRDDLNTAMKEYIRKKFKLEGDSKRNIGRAPTPEKVRDELLSIHKRTKEFADFLFQVSNHAQEKIIYCGGSDDPGDLRSQLKKIFCYEDSNDPFENIGFQLILLGDDALRAIKEMKKYELQGRGDRPDPLLLYIRELNKIYQKVDGKRCFYKFVKYCIDCVDPKAFHSEEALRKTISRIRKIIPREP